MKKKFDLSAERLKIHGRKLIERDNTPEKVPAAQRGSAKPKRANPREEAPKVNQSGSARSLDPDFRANPGPGRPRFLNEATSTKTIVLFERQSWSIQEAALRLKRELGLPVNDSALIRAMIDFCEADLDLEPGARGEIGRILREHLQPNEKDPRGGE